MNIRELTAYELGIQITEGKLSSPEATRAYLDAAKAEFVKAPGDTSKLNAFTELYEDEAMAAAEAVQERIDSGEYLSPIQGVPMALKDNICSVEGTTTSASKILSGFRSPYDAHVVENLREAGAIIIGKANMDEFAMGSATENSCYGPSRNPWDTKKTPGGSSGGSAAAVAAGLASYSLGSDTGGSVRQPAGYTGLTGVKPTYGSVSRYGLMAYGSSLDQIGPIAGDVRDASVILSIISGKDERDSTQTMEKPFRFCDIIHAELGDGRMDGRIIGIPANYFDYPGLSSEVKTCVLEAAKTMQDLGAEIVEAGLPHMEYIIPAYMTIAYAEASSNLARYDGVKYGHRSPGASTVQEIYKKSRDEGFGDEVKRRILFGTYVLTGENLETYYRKALAMRGLIAAAYTEALGKCDFLLTPVTRTTAFDIGGQNPETPDYLSDIFTAAANLSGLPAVSAPCGFDGSGLPIGMQLIGNAFDEGLLLDAIARYQIATDHHRKRPGGTC